MVKRHLKALEAPKFWKVSRKKVKWCIRPSPGKHPLKKCIPLGIIIRNILGYADTYREIKYILNNHLVKVDNKVRTDPGFPVGLMDVVSFDKINKFFRVIITKKGLELCEIKSDEYCKKLLQIKNKTMVRGGKLQLNCHDGYNLIVDDPKKYAVGDALLLDLANKEIIDHVKLKKGVTVLITGGKHQGCLAKLLDTKKFPLRSNFAVVASNIRFATSDRYIFPVGMDEPIITVTKS